MKALIVDHTAPPAEVIEIESKLQDIGCRQISEVAWNKLVKKRGEFNLVVLLGLGERKEDGFKIADAIHKRWPRALLLIVTHHGRDCVIQEARAHGNAEVLTTPISREEFSRWFARIKKTRLL